MGKVISKDGTQVAGDMTGTGNIYILDEPTTGLHLSDIDMLLDLQHGIVDRGNIVVVIEHNLAVIGQADWIIDLGPGGGKNGGEIVFTGTPEQLVRASGSLTGEYLRQYQYAWDAPERKTSTSLKERGLTLLL